jgi:hypothetical protein
MKIYSRAILVTISSVFIWCVLCSGVLWLGGQGSDVVFAGVLEMVDFESSLYQIGDEVIGIGSWTTYSANDDWTTPVVVGDVGIGNSQCMRIVGNEVIARPILGLPQSTTGELWVDLYIKYQGQPAGNIVLYVANRVANCVSSMTVLKPTGDAIFFNGTGDGGGSWADGGKVFADSEWHRLTLCHHTEKGNFQVYCDGQLVLEVVNFRHFTGTKEELEYFWIVVNPPGADSGIFVDNITIANASVF